MRKMYDFLVQDKVKQAIERVCKELPETVQGECSEFVDNYGSALVAILAQKIDPSQVSIHNLLHVNSSKGNRKYTRNNFIGMSHVTCVSFC